MPSTTAPTRTTTSAVEAATVTAELAAATIAVARHETYCMDSTWATCIESLINNLLLDGPTEVALYMDAPDRRPGSPQRRMTGMVEHGPFHGVLAFQDNATCDLAECTGLAVRL